MVEAVTVGVVVAMASDECVVLREDGQSLDLTSGRDKQTFTFDRVVTGDHVQDLEAELLQPLARSVRDGVSATLLMCGVGAEAISTPIFKQLLMDVFGQLTPVATEELLTTVSCVQFSADGSAVDLLSTNQQTLRPVTHPVLGCVVKGLSEVCVGSAQEALTLYEASRDTLKAPEGIISSRCSWLLSLAVEWKLQRAEAEAQAEAELQLCRSRLQLFTLAGGASRSDLRGVSPLLKALEHIHGPASAQQHLLPRLLTDALTGSGRTALIYCLQPHGLLDDETPSALSLAHKVRSLSTKPSPCHWCPKAAEREIRGHIMELRKVMMSPGGNSAQHTQRLAQLTHHLQVVKDQSWEKRREASEKIKQPQSAGPSAATPTLTHLQEHLSQELHHHLTEDRASMEAVQGGVARIQQLQEALREATEKNTTAQGTSDPRLQSQLEHCRARERRRRLREEHGRLIQEEAEKSRPDLAAEPLEGPQRELLVLSRERRLLVLQVEALRAQVQQAEDDLDRLEERHQTELLTLKEESLQVLRVFGQVSEERRRLSEGRYRSVLLDAVQDAVYLSAQNQQLQADNKQLRRALGELKDSLAARGEAEVAKTGD